MSKLWPDPFTDRGDDFWNFDSMVDEYDYEQRRKALKSREQSVDVSILIEDDDEDDDADEPESSLPFTQADRVKTELLLLEKDSDEESAQVVFKVKNNCSFPLELFKVSYNVCDRRGRILCEGMAYEYNTVRPGACTAVCDSIWPDGSFRKEEINEIRVSSYEYTAEGCVCYVDIVGRRASKYDSMNNDRVADYAKADIISYEVVDKEDEDEEWLDITYNVKNSSNAAVESIILTVCFYDKSGMRVGECDCAVEELGPGSGEEVSASFYREFDFQEPESFEVVKYEYTLKVPGGHGRRHYIIDKVLRRALHRNYDGSAGRI